MSIASDSAENENDKKENGQSCSNLMLILFLPLTAPGKRGSEPRRM